MLAFTSEQFLSVFASYNSAIWPIQIAAYLSKAPAIIAMQVTNPITGIHIGTVTCGIFDDTPR